MIVMKFGGTSVGGVEPIRRVVSIVKNKREERPIVVVSAMSKITDLLYRIASSARDGEVVAMEELLKDLKERHLKVAEELLSGDIENLRSARVRIHALCDSLAGFCHAVYALGELSPRSQATIVSYGELLSSTIVGRAMNSAGLKTYWVDARQMIITDDNRLEGKPDMDEIQRRVPQVINQAMNEAEAVITQGFIAAMPNGEATILGRGGSDYSASLIGMAIDAKTVEIWTDVDGILTTDPRIVPDARKLEQVSFEEAAEMAHFGAKVLHPMTIEPAVKKNIPIRVLNSHAPEVTGTQVLQDQLIEPGIKSISCKENILVMNIFSMKMIDAAGFLGKVFAVFGKHGVSVDLITTSEANISVTIDGKQNIKPVVNDLSEFCNVHVWEDKAQLSIVGKQLSATDGLIDKAFSNLEGVHVYMISQDAADISLSIVVDRDRVRDAVRTMHKNLFNSIAEENQSDNEL